MKSRVLVTGADGFIGSHLVEALVRRGEVVRAFVLYNSLGSWGWLNDAERAVQDAIEVIPGDIRDACCVKDAMRGCDRVLHLAALVAIPYSYRSPASYVETNIVGTLNVLQAVKELGVTKLVQTSTSEVYGTAQTVPINETHPLNAQSPYAATKIAADQLALSFYRSFSTPVTIIRPFNTYGPRQSTRAVLPTIITQLQAGTRVTLGALHPTRDFSFVSDTVAGFVAAAETDAAVGEIINLGSGHEISIRDITLVIAKLMDRNVEFADDCQRRRPAASEVQRLLADTSKAAHLLRWRPAYVGVDGLERGLLRTIKLFADNAKLGRFHADAYVI